MRLSKSAKWIVLVMIVGVVGAVVALNRDWLDDWWRGLGYRPSDEMALIRDKLQLTDRGRFVFDAVGPVLSGSEEFNSHCRTDYEKEEAILGCYVDDSVYVYNITAEELSGIRELTAAHELLHAVWARMSESDKGDLAPLLAEVAEANSAILAEELETYDDSQRQEELYVRAGTEVKQLPDGLEKHYAEVFADQDKVVGYYDSYIGVFNKMKAEMDQLMAEMEGIRAQIDSLSSNYESRLAQLNERIAIFNDCANRVGCFASESVFYSQRNALISEQDSLMGVYGEIERLVAEYNEKVGKYNEDVAYSNKLNSIVNSNAKPEKVE